MPRLRLSHQDSSWSELFKAAGVYRKLRVLVDAELLEGGAAAWTAESLLAPDSFATRMSSAGSTVMAVRRPGPGR